GGNLTVVSRGDCGGVTQDIDIAKFEQVLAKETAAKLLTALDTVKVERDEALDDAKGVILAKKLQQRLPACAYRSLTPRLPSTDCPTKESVLGRRHRSCHLRSTLLWLKWLLFKAKRATWAPRRQSCWRSLRSQLEAPQAELAQLRADSSEGAEGDASSQASGPLSGESRALIISGYLRSDAHRQREEFERTHNAHGGFLGFWDLIRLLGRRSRAVV
ncbi:hypothetical protein ACLOJK_023467, partial [Asimina triloba]